MMSGRIAILALASGAGVAACTATSGPQPNLTGSWTLNGVFYGDSDTLEISGLLMTLTQSGKTFVGSYSEAVFSVYNRGDTTSAGLPYPSYTYVSPPVSGQILNGVASGALVAFSLDTTSQGFRGVTGDSAMQGAGSVYYLGSQTAHNFTGNWTATRN
jgi:hypothetical protein